MNSDITKLKLYNVIDSCSVWNILLSPTIYQASINAGCYYSVTNYVKYECLVKRRGTQRNTNAINTLQREISQNRFTACDISIDDLQEMEILENRKRLGKGELSSIVFAKKTKLAFMTDDRKARKLGDAVLGKEYVQTTPHLVGFCFYERHLIDGDFPKLIEEHKATLRGNWGDLSPYFQEVYEESHRIRLINREL
ncbi:MULTISPECIES: hypothetical protein [Flavobacteriales]|uniref:hypothetical protein n=1 Tax=Flavobacteriales TaxID=200644 RepID=UPI0020B25C65|nr:hypothetical protein [Elizabethkingia anophelis]UTF96838.1 hypothetical protein J2N94_00710 [Elizabethkingia anophelis]